MVQIHPPQPRLPDVVEQQTQRSQKSPVNSHGGATPLIGTIHAVRVRTPDASG